MPFAKPFYYFLLARVSVSLTATVLSVTIGWHLYQATGDPFDLALVGLMQILPIILLFIVSGWVVDNFSRRHVLMLCAALQIFVFVGLAAILSGGVLNKHLVFALLFINGCMRAFIAPALQAVLPNIVSKENLARAVALTTSSWTAATTAGPFLAGLLIAWLDFGTYWLLAVLAVLTLLFFSLLPNMLVEKPSGRGVQQLLEGMRFVLANPLVLPGISLDMFIVLVGSVVALLPVFAVDVLKVGPETLGLLRAMPALGAVMAGAVFSRWPIVRKAGLKLFLALAVFSGAILVFALSKQVWLSLVALWFYGAADVVSVNIRTTVIQLATPDRLRGRVGAVSSLFIATSNDMGDFRAGSVAAAIGAVPAVLTGAFMAFGITLAGYRLFPTLRRMDRMADISAGSSKPD